MATLEASLPPTSGRRVADAPSAAPMSSRATRAIALVGLASFVLIIIAAFVSPPLWNAPGTNATAARVAEYVQANHARSLAALFMYSIAMGLFLCFAGGLWSWLRRTERSPQPLSAVFAFGAVSLTMLIFAGFAAAGVMSYRPQQPAFAASLSDMTFALLALSGIPTAVALNAYAALVLKNKCLPAWTAWLAMLAADAHVLIAASFLSHEGFLSLEGEVIVAVPATFFAWILATSLALLRRGADCG
jgi:hypothetical protein